MNEWSVWRRSPPRLASSMFQGSLQGRRDDGDNPHHGSQSVADGSSACSWQICSAGAWRRVEDGVEQMRGGQDCRAALQAPGAILAARWRLDKSLWLRQLRAIRRSATPCWGWILLSLFCMSSAWLCEALLSQGPFKYRGPPAAVVPTLTVRRLARITWSVGCESLSAAPAHGEYTHFFCRCAR